jgi:electron transport complex protein RnfC
MKIYSFPRGGLSFDDPTVPSRDSFGAAFLPVFSVIPLGANSRGRIYPLVSVGDTVREGQLLGRASGAGMANVHSAVPGRVIRKVFWSSGGGANEGFVIRMEGAFEKLGHREEIFPWNGMASYDIQRIIAEYGVVEMEGGGRPVAEKISAFRNSAEPQTLVLRCVFDDPWLAADYVLCRERFKAVAEGAFIAARCAGKISRILIAVSHREKDLGESLFAEAANRDIPSSLVLTGSRYPQRNSRELELALRSFGKKEGIELGSLLILGPATLAAVHDAVKLKKPVLERYVAVGGSAVRRPQVMKARIGTRIGELVNECGGFSGRPKQIAFGSPLLGSPAADLDEPVGKTSYAIFAGLKSNVRESEGWSCISCGECRDVCPVGLDPEELYKRIAGRPKSEWPIEAEECHGCGCCQVVCPSRLPLSCVIQGFSREEGHG